MNTHLDLFFLMIPYICTMLCAGFQSEWAEMWAGVGEGLKKGWLRPRVAQEYALDSAPQAHHDVIHNTGTLGKRAIVP